MAPVESGRDGCIIMYILCCTDLIMIFILTWEINCNAKTVVSLDFCTTLQIALCVCVCVYAVCVCLCDGERECGGGG